MPQLFQSAVITSDGIRLLTKAQSGNAKIEFTRVETGNGSYTKEEKDSSVLMEMTGLKSVKNSYGLSDIRIHSDHCVKVTALIANYDSAAQESLITEGYYLNEIGLYAREKDAENDEEVLYSIAVTSGENGDFMPPYNGLCPVEIVQEYYAAVSNSNEVTIQGSMGAVALAEDLQEAEGKIDVLEEKLKNYHVLRILGTYDSKTKFVGFASLPLPASGGRAETTLLVSGVGNIASPSCGTYLVQCGTRTRVSMMITELTPPGSSGDITFGFWQTDDRVIFGMKRGPYNYHTNIAMISEDVNGDGFSKYEIGELYNDTATPSGWTEAGKRIFLTIDQTAAASSKLAAPRTIDGVKFDGTGNITHFGICSTAAATVAKTVSVSNFVLAAGAEVKVLFSNGNTVGKPTLNVNGTGAKQICYKGAALTVDAAEYIMENSLIHMVYTGSVWHIVGDLAQRQLNDLKKFIHYEEYFWMDENIALVQDEGFAWDYYSDHGSAYPAYKKEMIYTQYAKCTYVPIINAYDPNEVYKIITHDLDLSDRLEHYSPIGIGYDNDPIYNSYDFLMLSDDESDIQNNGVIKNENGIYIVTPYKLNAEHKKTGMVLFINSWGSPSDIIVYRGNYKAW